MPTNPPTWEDTVEVAPPKWEDTQDIAPVAEPPGYVPETSAAPLKFTPGYMGVPMEHWEKPLEPESVELGMKIAPTWAQALRLLPPEKEEAARKALATSASGALKGIVSPTGLALAGATVLNPPAGLAGMVILGQDALREGIKKLDQAETFGEKVEAAADIGQAGAMIVGGPLGLRGPRTEPARAPVTPLETRPAPPLTPPPPVPRPVYTPDVPRLKPPRPEVPVTPPEPERGLNVLEEIRQANAKTRKQIQSLFPRAKLSNEQAARLRDEAWGTATQKPVTMPEAPIPSPEDQAALRQELADLQEEPAAPAAPIERTPDASRIEEAAKIHGDVRPLAEPTGQLPVKEGGEGVQPQAEGRVQEAPTETLPNAPARESVLSEPTPKESLTVELDKVAEKTPTWEEVASGAYPVTGKPAKFSDASVTQVNPRNYNAWTEVSESLNPGDYFAWDSMFPNRAHPELEHKWIGQLVKVIRKGSENEYPKLQYKDLETGEIEEINDPHGLKRLDNPDEVLKSTQPPSKTAVGKGVQKAQAKVAQVARTEGTRSAKEIKAELVKRLEQAVADAPFTTDEYFPGLYVKEARSLNETTHLTDRPVEGTRPLAVWLDLPFTKKDKTPNRDMMMGKKFIAEALERKQVKKVTIEIPDDGVFTVWNTKDALQSVLDRAKRIKTSTTPPKGYVERSGPGPAERKAIVAEAEALAKQPTPPLAAETGEKTAATTEPEPELLQRSASWWTQGNLSSLPREQLDRIANSLGVKKTGKPKGIYAADILAKAQQRLKAIAESKPVNSTGTTQDPLPPFGVGAARAGEIGIPAQQTAGYGGDIYGIAERARTERAKAGQVMPIPPGVGTTPLAQVERGRALIAQGANPEKSMAAFEKTRRLSADDMDIARAHGEDLAKAARRTEEQFGTASAEYRNAWHALSAWDARSKVMQTEWHKMGMGQQGETDLDTGTFTGLQRAHQQATGHEFTPQQVKRAKIIAEQSQAMAQQVEQARQNVFTEIEKATAKTPVPEPKDIGNAREMFAQYKTGEAFSPQQVRTIWNAARKFYIDRGVTDFNDIIHGLAADFGLKEDMVKRALASPQNVAKVADDMWKKQYDARRLRSAAIRWLYTTDSPAYERAIASIPSLMFRIKVGFHGTVALGTHAPMVAFQPRFWANYARDFGKMYKMVGSPAFYEQEVQALVRRPNYVLARRAGLVNDPMLYEDFTAPETAKYFGRLAGMGNRGYTILKILRQDMFDQMWDKLPAEAKLPEVATALSDGINHAVGVVKGRAPKGSNIALFAPRLLASRVMWLAGDPMRAVRTGARIIAGKETTLADRMFAVNQVKEKAWVFGTMMSMLAVNQGILSLMNSNQRINITDPYRSDWMKFKVAGMDLAYGNAMISMARLPVRMYRLRDGRTGKIKNFVYADEDTYTFLGQWARGQASPFAALLADLWFKADYANRPLPHSEKAVPKRLRAQGLERYTWAEFLSEEMLPIPFEEAAKEVWKTGLGASPEQVAELLKAFATLAVMSGTGSRFTEDTHTLK